MADDRDILTLDEAKRALRIEDNAENLELEGYITSASRILDDWAGHTVAHSVTNELHDGVNESGRGGRRVIVLRNRPVRSVSSVVEYSDGVATTLSAEAVTSLPDDGYMLYPYKPDAPIYSGFVRRRSSGGDAWYAVGRQNISFTYTPGRVETTADVDARFKRACAIVLENLWRDRQPGVDSLGEFDVPHQSFPTFAMPRAVAQMLSEEIGQNQPGIA